MTRKLAILSFLVLAPACSMLSKGKSVSAGGDTGGGGDAPKGLAGTMAEAQTFHIGDNLEAPAGCNTSGYMKIDAPAGQAFHVAFTTEGPEGSCINVTYLNSNGGSSADGGQMFGDICTDKSPRTLDVVGIQGGSYLEVSESPPCKNASMKISLQ